MGVESAEKGERELTKGRGMGAYHWGKSYQWPTSLEAWVSLELIKSVKRRHCTSTVCTLTVMEYYTNLQHEDSTIIYAQIEDKGSRVLRRGSSHVIMWLNRKVSILKEGYYKGLKYKSYWLRHLSIHSNSNQGIKAARDEHQGFLTDSLPECRDINNEQATLERPPTTLERPCA